MGIALQGPAVMHLQGMSFLLDGYSIRCGYESPNIQEQTTRCILKSTSLSTRLLVDPFIFLALWIFFQRCCPTMEVTLRSNHGAYMFGILDFFHFAKFITICRNPIQQFIATFAAILYPTAFRMIDVESSHAIHNHKGWRQGVNQ